MEIPDCYDPVYQADRREEEADKYTIRCELCDKVITEDVFIWEGMNICECCFMKAIHENFDARDFAEAFKIPVVRPWQI